MNQPKLKVLIKNCFLYSCLFLVFLLISCIKATIYKNDENLETSFHLNFTRLPLGWNLRYSCKYYIAKRLAKTLIYKPNPKDIQLGFKTNLRFQITSVLKGSSISWFLLHNKRAKLLYNKKTIQSNKRESQNLCHL